MAIHHGNKEIFTGKGVKTAPVIKEITDKHRWTRKRTSRQREKKWKPDSRQGGEAQCPQGVAKGGGARISPIPFQGGSPSPASTRSARRGSTQLE